LSKRNLQPNARRGKAKARSTAADILEELSAQHPLPAKIIEYREIAKLNQPYVDASSETDPSRKRALAYSFRRLARPRAGLVQRSQPQNIPIRTSWGREIRAAFVAEKGKVLLSADFSQMSCASWRIFERPCACPGFPPRRRHHAPDRARKFSGVGPIGQHAEHRRARKAINFGIIYGFRHRLAQQLGIEQKEGGEIHQRLFHAV